MTGRLLRGSLLASFAVLACAACSRNYAALPPAQVCASDETLARIKHAAFSQAAAQASSQTRYALDELARQSQTRLLRPLVESYDRDTRKTTCTADLDLWLPAGVASPRELHSPIHYDSQPTADGRDVVFEVSGLEQVAAGVAGADLDGWAKANAPRKPGLVVEVVARDSEPTQLAETSPPPAPVPRSAPAPVARSAPAPTRDSLAPPPPSPPPIVSAKLISARPVYRSPRPEPAQPSGVSAGPVPLVSAEPVGGRPVRVFVHVSDPSHLAEADQVRAQLEALSIAGAKVATPPVRFVADMPRRTEVRCLKHADCQAARVVASYLARRLGAPVTVVDMSATYETDAGVRPGSIELWLRPSEGAPTP